MLQKRQDTKLNNGKLNNGQDKIKTGADTIKNGPDANLCDELRTLIINLGASFVGFSNVYELLPEALKRYPYAISFGVRLSNAIIDEIEDKPTYTYYSHYRSVNALIDNIGLRVMLYLQDKGHRAYSIPASQSIPDAPQSYSGLFPHKTGAVASGLGWIGKNGLLIHGEYGPRVRLGTVLTDLELPCGYPTDWSGAESAPEETLAEKVRRVCRSCNRCVSACPAMALTGNEWHPGVRREDIVDAKACSDYMKEKFKHIGRGDVCGICISVCPLGKA